MEREDMTEQKVAKYSEPGFSFPDDSPSGWWWLSFAEDSDDGRFLGACIVEGKTVFDAVARATELGINPGGEAAGCPIAEDARVRTPSTWLNRFLSDRECDEWPWPEAT
jgi:hypothetical protein